VQKHQARTIWVEEHLTETIQLLGLSPQANWKVRPIIVVVEPMLSARLRDLPDPDPVPLDHVIGRGIRQADPTQCAARFSFAAGLGDFLLKLGDNLAALLITRPEGLSTVVTSLEKLVQPVLAELLFLRGFDD